jgi:hypothetical protein
VVQYVLYPLSILTGLAKVGGLIAILRIGFFLNILNQRWFEAEIKKELSKDHSDAYIDEK